MSGKAEAEAVEGDGILVMGGKGEHGEPFAIAPVSSDGSVFETCGQCDERYQIEPGCTKYKLVDHCYKCSSRSRSVTSSTSDKAVQAWFRGLRTTNPGEYRKILADADRQVAESTGAKLSNFDLARYRESSNQIRGSRMQADCKLMTFPWYKDWYQNQVPVEERLTGPEVLAAWERSSLNLSDSLFG